jgi:single-stranded DNA-binding protein
VRFFTKSDYKIMNTCSFLVKIVSAPQQRLIADNINLVETQVQFAKLRKKKSFDQIQISIWGNLGSDFLKYYRVGDYIIIKGILSFKRNQSANPFQKETIMTVIKLYPFLLAD